MWAMILVPVTVAAHEVGTTRVIAAFSHDDHYRIDVTTDASMLLARLQVARHQPRTTPISREEYQLAIEALCAEVPRHLSVEFDAGTSVPTAACAADAAGNAPATDLNALGVTVTLGGVVPPLAKTFRWKYDLTAASYQLAVAVSERETGPAITLEGGDQSQPISVIRLPAPPSRWMLALSHFKRGVVRILPNGLFQILFLLGVLLLGGPQATAWQVGAFALAETLAASLSLYGFIAGSPPMVEPMLVVSLVYVAAENFLASDLKPWRFAPVFGFGLVHGTRLADSLRELTLPRAEFFTGLVGFIAGVQAGQLAVILCACALLRRVGALEPAWSTSTNCSEH